MSELGFRVIGARAEPFAVTPTLIFELELEEPSGVPIHTVALNTQIRIQPQRRRYSSDEQERLLDLFGAPHRWGETLKPMLFAHVSTMVGGFDGKRFLELPVACTYDFEVSGAKYFHALESGEIPLLFLFSGTVFARGPAGFEVHRISWARDATYAMPVAVWRELIDRYFPGSGWIRLRSENLHALQRFKAERALTSLDDALATLLAGAREKDPA